MTGSVSFVNDKLNRRWTYDQVHKIEFLPHGVRIFGTEIGTGAHYSSIVSQDEFTFFVCEEEREEER